MAEVYDHEAVKEAVLAHRLGLCEVCNAVEAKYTCPKCEVKTCSLNCSTIHKKELECDGVRDKTKYIPKSKMTTMDYESDYRFLEECTRFVATRQRDPIKQTTNTQGLPHHLIRIRTEAGKRKTTVRFLFANFSKRKQNTTRYDVSDKKILWRVQWVLVNSQGAIREDNEVDEGRDLCEVFQDHLKNDADTLAVDFDFYKSRSLNQLLFLLKAEGIPGCSYRFYEIDIRKPLKETLQNKIIVEFPVIHVTFAESRSQFDIIPEDEEVELLATAQLTKKIKQEEVEEQDIKPSLENLLFSNEHFWQSSDEEEDEDGLKPAKLIKKEIKEEPGQI